MAPDDLVGGATSQGTGEALRRGTGVLLLVPPAGLWLMSGRTCSRCYA